MDPDRVILGNPLGAYAASIIAFVLVLGGLALLRLFVGRRLTAWAKDTPREVDDFLASALGSIRSFEYALLAFFVATRSLDLGAGLDKVLRMVFTAALTLRAAFVVQGLMLLLTGRALRRAGGGSAAAAIKNLRVMLRAAIWAGALLFFLANLGVNVTAALAGLGIGGIAVAMASQQILGDLFSSFVIYLDRPFVVGDFIVVTGDLAGTVEHVGIKTTRLRSVGGELIVASNSFLTSSRVRNYRRMERRHAVFSFGVSADTPAEKLEKVPAIVARAVSSAELARFDRAHLHLFGSASLEYEAAYFVLSADHGRYMDAQQSVNLGILRGLAAEGIRLARPPQTAPPRTS